MKKMTLVLLVIVACASMMFAQQAGKDTLGGHLLNGRGCAGCHAPHSGALGNGIATADPNSGDIALWGGDVKPLFGATLKFGDLGNFATVMPSDMSGDSHGGATGTSVDPRIGGLLMCLSCHDGNLSTGAMMKNKVYETLPAGVYGTNPIPTLLGVGGDYKNDHPVGEAAVISCGGTRAWDCTITNGTVNMTGPQSAQFVANYGFTVAPGKYYGGTATASPIVVCTTCHDQHVMTVYNGKIGGVTGFYTTYFGVKGKYDPSVATGNSTAQFCRQCHGSHANEFNGVTNVPTT